MPFCRHRCGYCNFSVVADRDELIERYLSAIDQELALLDRPELSTLYIGGGTPTHLSMRQLERLLELLQTRFRFGDELEFSVEANPEDIDTDKVRLLASRGVNRISMGVQSFDDQKLSVLERTHSGPAVEKAVGLAAEHIGNVSIDLIFAAPGESLETWQADLQAALRLPIKHLSTYALTFEKGTSFWSRRRSGDLKAASDQLEVDMYQFARNATASAGVEHYEISSFARPGHRCQHNLAYWKGRGWYAAGPGAARFVDGVRTCNHRSTTTYLKKIEQGEDVVAESERLSWESYARERAAFGIRMIDGINLCDLATETRVDVQTELASAIESNVKNGWITEVGGHIKLTPEGILFADAVAAEFL